MSVAASQWMTLSDARRTLQTKWERGGFLSDHFGDAEWEPVRVRLRGPKATDLAHHLNEIRSWSETLEGAQMHRGAKRFEIEYKTLKNRAIGHNDVPAALVFETWSDLVAFIDVGTDVESMRRALDHLDNTVSLDTLHGSDGDPYGWAVAREWMIQHPHRVIAVSSDWERIVAVVQWIADREVSAMDIRHLDVPGVDAVDTKFVETHQGILRALLDCVLPPERIDRDQPVFSLRYQFRPRPTYVRFRLLDDVKQLPLGITELTMREDELAELELEVDRVFIVENQASYLAFPRIPRSIVIFGSGFKVASLGTISWLHERDIIYWGDIDLAGFAILNMVRQLMPHAQSMLMDRETLTAHLAHVGTDSLQGPVDLPHLTTTERRVYEDLVEDRYGKAVRLEQERIRFSAVSAAIERVLEGRP